MIGNTDLPCAEKIRRIFASLDELSVILGSLALDVMQHDFAFKDSSAALDEQEEHGLPSVILQAVVRNATESDGVAFGLLSSLHVDLKQVVCFSFALIRFVAVTD
jgi:hypothetical protein